MWAGWRGSAAWDDGKGYCGVLDGSLLSPRSRHSKGRSEIRNAGSMVESVVEGGSTWDGSCDVIA